MRERDADGQCPIDLEVALEYAGGDEAFLRELFVVFLEEARGNLAALRDAVVAGRAGDVRDLAHTVKGLLRLLGAPGTALLAEQIELAGCAARLDDLGPDVARFEEEMLRLLQWVTARLAAPGSGTAIASETA